MVNNDKLTFKQKVSKHKGIIILVIVVIVAGFIFLRPSTDGLGADFATVEKIDYTNTSLITGEVEADLDIELSFERAGVIRSVLVDDGDYVREGTKIATLESNDLESEKREQEALLEEEKVLLAKLERGPSEVQRNAILATTETVRQELESGIDKSISTIYSTTTALKLVVKQDVDQLFSNADRDPTPSIEITDQGDERALISGRVEVGEVLNKFTMHLEKVQEVSAGSDPVEEKYRTIDEILESLLNGAGVILNNINLLFDEVSKYEEKTSSAGLYTTQVGQSLERTTSNLNILAEQKSNLNSAFRKYEDAKQEEIVSTTTDPKELDVQRARVKATEERVVRINRDISDSNLIAPFSGTISDIEIKAGQRISALESALRISDDRGSLYVKASASQNDLQYLVEGGDVDISIDALNAMVDGTIRSINEVETIVNNTPVYTVFVEFSEEVEGLRIGMSSDVFFPQEEIEGVLAVPLLAIERDGPKAFAYLVSGDEFEKVEVETGRLLGTNIEILSGLVEGDIVSVSDEK